ncbi:DUF2061 domain-containing protein [Photobacterium angustum]|uniref:DUF2061 domain-containing protein n=1 Tax=Photobacterium angustum TaxID=661 RepID=A0A855SAY5_PHOAN|nr:DUF2061 domain-containing protein [Photobacterium angustum]KJF81777.1 membrane protein [Photobacterium damselae subsp. damselae]KJG28690.1 membrane protein [Photobacterium angustum]KJG37049.1 membrane protein [Photobacterium angustum]KJG45451.1 membrane protein [Photobacterium angustum]KJG46580.1 membrane protein [Photobacterium angustum]
MKKTISFAAIHFTVAFSVAYLLTGDIIIGSLIAMIEPMVNTVAFYFHEKVWQNKTLKQSRFSTPSRKTVSFAIVHFSVAFSVVYLLTGDILIGSLMAMIEPSINTMAYYFHERVWQRKDHNQVETHQPTWLDAMACQH